MLEGGFLNFHVSLSANLFYAEVIIYDLQASRPTDLPRMVYVGGAALVRAHCAGEPVLGRLLTKGTNGYS